MKKTALFVLFVPLTACGIDIDGDFDFPVSVSSSTRTYTDSGTVDPCSNEEVRDNADKLDTADIISVVMTITALGQDNAAETASATATIGGVSRTVENVAIAVGTEVDFEFTSEELATLSESVLACQPLEWTVDGEANTGPVSFEAQVNVDAVFEASVI